jgi:soluble lytic murein transglycosylase
LQNRRYFFLPNNFITLALCLAFFLIFPGCQKAYIWGIKREEFDTRIKRGDFSFLHDIDFSEFNIEDILDYAPGAAYYLSHVAKKLNYGDVVEKLLVLEWNRGSPPWKYQAAAELAEIYIEQKRFQNAKDILSTFLSHHRSAYNLQHILRLEIQTLYKLEEDEELLKKLDEYVDLENSDDWVEKYPELILFKAAAGCRLGQQGWEAFFLQLFYTVPACELHSRAYMFLVYDEQRLTNFLKHELDILKAKSLMVEGKYEAARPLLKQGIVEPSRLRLKDSILPWDYGTVCLKTKSAADEAEFLESLADQAAGRERQLTLEMAAKVYALNRYYKRAQDIWRTILKETDDSYLKKRAQWYMLKYALERGSSAVLSEVSLLLPHWEDFDYFSDLLEGYISSLLWKKDYTSLYKLYLMFQDTAPNELRAQLSYIVARLISLGFIKGRTLDVEKLASQLSTKDGYYSFLSAHFLHTQAQSVLGESKNYRKTAGFTDSDKFIFGFFDFGLCAEGYERLKTADPLPQPDAVFNLAASLKERGQYLSAIRVLHLLTGKEKKQLSKDEALIVYPLAYEEEITKAAARYGLDQLLFFSLIRRESAFDNQIVSRAGAVGLTQLMPATAEDVARRMDLSEIDLTDPEQNALIGAFFLADLLRRFENIPRALAAYNAGPARVKSWENTIGTYPNDLYIEAIPILETRRFVKFICTAAVYYSYLYNDMNSPSERIGALIE